jgi:pimeloyl-ACP methyl ester carboxylesterase
MATQVVKAPVRAAVARRSADYKTVSVNGCELAYVDRGSGDAVAFVHGGISDLRIWERQMAAFSENHRAVAYSRRYAWPNIDIPDGVDDQMLPHVEDLAALLGALDLKPAHVVGNSWGGFICLLTALRHPELVRSLTVEEPPVLPLFLSTPPKPRELLKVLLTRPRTCVALVGFMARGFAPSISALKKGDLEGSVAIFARAVLGADVYESLPADVKAQMLANAGTHRAQFLGAGFPTFTDDDAHRITTPTLLVTGEKSPAFMLRLTDRLEELLPNTERVSIPNASHVMHYQNPGALNGAVLDFIARH